MRLIGLILLISFFGSVHGRFCGLEYMKIFYSDEKPTICFYVQLCVPRDDLLSTVQKKDNYIENSMNSAESHFIDTVMSESALMIRSTDAALQFLQKLFSNKSKILEKNAPEWMKYLGCDACGVRIQKVSRNQYEGNYDVVARVCPNSDFGLYPQ